LAWFGLFIAVSFKYFGYCLTLFQQARSEHRKGAALADLRSALEGKLSTDLDAQVLIPHLSETRSRAQQYAGLMLRHFGGPAPAEYLSRHPDEYVVAVRLSLRPADMPRRPDGSVDIEAFPERIFGSEHVKRHPDGSTEYIDIPESKFRELDQRVLHRATCSTLNDHDDQYQMICGTREELEQIMEEYDKLCPACL
jgi:hypothetical protein